MNDNINIEVKEETSEEAKVDKERLNILKEWSCYMMYLYHNAIRGQEDGESIRRALYRIANVLDKEQHNTLIHCLLEQHERLHGEPFKPLTVEE